MKGLARHLRYRHILFLVGATPESGNQVDGAVENGIGKQTVATYLETFHRYNVFAQPAVENLLHRHGVGSLAQLPQPKQPDLVRSLEDYLRRHGIHAVLNILCASSTAFVVMAVIEPESRAFTPVDLQLIWLVGRHLRNLVRWHTNELTETSSQAASLPGLTPRQAEVVALVARGLSNVEIARELYVGVDTVKKHVTAALAANGFRNRTQLSLYWLSNVGKRCPVDRVSNL